MLGRRASVGGKFSNPAKQFGLSPLFYTSCGGPPTAGTTQLQGGDPEAVTDAEPVSAPHPQIQSPTVVHESPQYIVVEESPTPPPQPNPVSSISSPPPPREGADIGYVNGIAYLIRPSRSGSPGGGGIPPVGGCLHQLLRATHPHFALRGAPLVPLSPGGLLAEAVAGHLLLMGVEVPHFNILGAPLKHGGRLT